LLSCSFGLEARGQITHTQKVGHSQIRCASTDLSKTTTLGKLPKAAIGPTVAE
jgi:hypothetical protein